MTKRGDGWLKLQYCKLGRNATFLYNLLYDSPVTHHMLTTLKTLLQLHSIFGCFKQSDFFLILINFINVFSASAKLPLLKAY